MNNKIDPQKKEKSFIFWGRMIIDFFLGGVVQQVVFISIGRKKKNREEKKR